jgi:hypothetical protein
MVGAQPTSPLDAHHVVHIIVLSASLQQGNSPKKNKNKKNLSETKPGNTMTINFHNYTIHGWNMHDASPGKLMNQIAPSLDYASNRSMIFAAVAPL